jgi:hypothetical protein
MELAPFIDRLRQDLLTASDAIGPESRPVAERLMVALDPAVRLVLLEVLAQSAAEITAELPAGVVDVRLRGREPELVVEVPGVPQQHPAAGPVDAPVDGTGPDDEDDGTVARISLRLPESVKTRAEDLAARGGQSLNSWIVTVLRAATSKRAINVDIDLSSIPFGDSPGGRGRGLRGWA